MQTQTVSITFYRFGGLLDRAWALTQMAFTNARLRRVPDIGFCKVFGTGSGESFDPFQNFGVYAILATWPDLDTARRRVDEAPVFRAYADRSAEHWTVYLRPVKAWGRWDGGEPFEATGTAPSPAAVGVLTRATLKKRFLPAFWKRVPAISDATVREGHLLFKLGMGEIPLLHQVTFSVWNDFEAMVTFAYRSGAHREAVKMVREHGWFAEQLFARFDVLDFEGSWGGRPPLPLEILAPATAPAPRGETVRAADAA